MQLVIGIATAGRREVLADTIDHLAGQIRMPDRVIICPAAPEDIDLDRLAGHPLPWEVVSGARGSCAQRNAILDAAPDADVIIFFDDDFLPANSFLAQVEALFTARPDIVVATGKVLADGIHGPGLTVEQGLAILSQDQVGDDAQAAPFPVHNAYGCNMVLRRSAIAAAGARFDEAMPLYGWQEDVDLCRLLAGQGAIVNSPMLRGVHLGVKRGRTPGLRLGYSQIANPLYMVGKGTVSWRWALNLMGRNFLANLAGSLKPQGLVDRRGRLKGNLIAIGETLTGKASPQRVLSL